MDDFIFIYFVLGVLFLFYYFFAVLVKITFDIYELTHQYGIKDITLRSYINNDIDQKVKKKLKKLIDAFLTKGTIWVVSILLYMLGYIILNVMASLPS